MTNKRMKPEEIELEVKRQELVELEKELKERKRRLLVLKKKMASAVEDFLKIIVPRYARIEKLRLQIVSLIANKWDREDVNDIVIRMEQNQFNIKDRFINTSKVLEKKEIFKPSEELTRLYKEAARIIDPNLATTKLDKTRRAKFMQKINEAYNTCEHKWLEVLLTEWESSPENVKGKGIGSKLVGVIRKIHQIQNWISQIEREEDSITSSEEYKLYEKIYEADARGNTYIADFANKLDEEIFSLEKELANKKSLEENIFTYKIINRERSGNTKFENKFLKLAVGLSEKEKAEKIETLQRTFLRNCAKQVQWTPDTRIGKTIEVRIEEQIIEMLLRDPWLANVRFPTGNTPLVFSVDYGWGVTTETIIILGADVNEKSNDGKTPIFNAAYNGYLALCELLVAKGANVDEQDTDGTTALILAAQAGNWEVCEFLISVGADVNEKTNSGFTALMSISSEGHRELCEYIVDKGANINARDINGWTALMLASHNGHKEVCELLVSKGANVNDKNNNGWTALMVVAMQQWQEEVIDEDWGQEICRHEEVCEFLLSEGADINEQDINGWTALMLANSNEWYDVIYDIDGEEFVENGHKIACEFLIHRGANVNEKDNDGRTAIMQAANNNRREVCEYLANKGANVNGKDNNGWTALIIASDKGHKEICELLIANGAELNQRDNEGITPLGHAEHGGYTELANYLRSVGGMK